MGTIVTVMNMKGGVGKTVVSSHLAGMLAVCKFTGRQRSVLMIDYFSRFLGGGPSGCLMIMS
jgi:chromosome partitioning protein